MSEAEFSEDIVMCFDDDLPEDQYDEAEEWLEEDDDDFARCRLCGNVLSSVYDRDGVCARCRGYGTA